MRSTGFALLGITAAMGLGLVALVSQQTWPYLPVGPIPGYHTEHGSLDSAIALAPTLTGIGNSAGDRPARGSLMGGATAAAGSSDSRVYGSRRVPSQPTAPNPVPGQPAAGVAPAPVADPAEPAPDPLAPVSVPVASPAPSPASPPSAEPASPPTPPAGASGNPGKGHAYGSQKAVSAPKEKAPHPAPHSLPPAAVPAAVEAIPPAAEVEPPSPVAAPSDGPGNGRGHAYGHDR